MSVKIEYTKRLRVDSPGKEILYVVVLKDVDGGSVEIEGKGHNYESAFEDLRNKLKRADYKVLPSNKPNKKGETNSVIHRSNSEGIKK